MDQADSISTAPPGPRVTALIVSFNCVAPLRRCLKSLLASRQRETLEILAVDQGSSDGSNRVDEEFNDVTVLRLPHYIGLTRARNIGIRTAKGEHLLFLTPDVEVQPDTVAALADTLAARPDALAVCPMLVDEEGKAAPQVFRLPGKDDLYRVWRGGELEALPIPDLAGDPVAVELSSGKALLIRKQTLQGINYLDEKFGEHWIDAEVCYEIRRAGKKILLLPQTRAVVQTGGLWRPSTSAERAAFAADCALGAAAYLKKHEGFGAGLGLQVKATLRAVAAAVGGSLVCSDLAYRWGLVARLFAGQKLDGGTQSM